MRAGSLWTSIAVCVLAVVALALLVIPAIGSPEFSDVPDSHPYKAGIEDLSGRGIITGYPDNTFRPDNAVIRQQFAKMIVKTLGYPVSEADSCPFTDVPLSLPGSYLDLTDPYYPDHYVAVCATHGITRGRTATTFAPYDSITRQQLVSMLVRAAGLAEPPASYSPPFGPGQFSPEEHYLNARKAAYAALLDGIQGLGPAYDFLASATRGECAQLLHNLLVAPTPPTTPTSHSTTTTGGSTTTTIAGGRVFHVATTGDDGAAGTPERPWRTIQHAVDQAGAGDTILVRAGTYEESVYIQKTGRPGAPLVLSAYPGETPAIDGSNVTDWNNGVIVDESAYIEIRGFEIRDWNDNGLMINASSNLTVSACVIHDVGGGAQLLNGSHDFTFDRVEAHNVVMFGFDASPSEGGAPCYNGTFTQCSAHTGADRDQNVDGFALGHGEQHDFTLERCEVYDVFDGFDMSARRTTVSRCSVRDCWNTGFKLWNDDITVVNCLIYNNQEANVTRCFNGPTGTATLQNCTIVGANTFNISIEDTRDSLRMYNCVLAGGANIGLSFENRSATNYQGDHNVFHNDNTERLISVGYEDEFSTTQLDGWRTYSGQDAHSVVVGSLDEVFVGPGQADYHLKPGSVAVDAGGSNGAPGTDYDGRARPQGQAVDIGAFEGAGASQ